MCKTTWKWKKAVMFFVNAISFLSGLLILVFHWILSSLCFLLSSSSQKKRLASQVRRLWVGDYFECSNNQSRTYVQPNSTGTNCFLSSIPWRRAKWTVSDLRTQQSEMLIWADGMSEACDARLGCWYHDQTLREVVFRIARNQSLCRQIDDDAFVYNLLRQEFEAT